MLDGFDLVVLGTVIPLLLKGKVFGITPPTATAIATTGLIGMTIGAMTIGAITDYLGRRRVMIFAVTIFSIFTLAVAFSTSVFTFSLYRFLAGLGLGGCLPTAITLVTEFARKGKASSAATTVMTDYHVGAVLTALLALVVVSKGHGWEWMFVIGGIPGLILAPLMRRFLSESEVFLEQKAIDVAIAQATLCLLSLSRRPAAGAVNDVAAEAVSPPEVLQSGRRATAPVNPEQRGRAAEPDCQRDGSSVRAPADEKHQPASAMVGPVDTVDTERWRPVAESIVREGVTSKHPQLVAAILAQREAGVPPSTIGRHHKVHHTTVGRILSAAETLTA
jgi:hypothetical protein